MISNQGRKILEVLWNISFLLILLSIPFLMIFLLRAFPDTFTLPVGIIFILLFIYVFIYPRFKTKEVTKRSIEKIKLSFRDIFKITIPNILKLLSKVTLIILVVFALVFILSITLNSILYYF